MPNVLLFFLVIFFNTTTANETIIAIVPLENRPASEIQPLLQPLLDKQSVVIAHDNSLIIRATPEQLQALKQLIKKLDTPLSNLTITVVQSRSLSAERLNASADFQISATPENFSGYIRGRFTNKNTSNDRDSTQVINTLDGTPALIKTGKNQPFRSRSYFYTREGYPAINSQTEYIELTTGFQVTPRLSGKQVIVEISPWSDQINNEGDIETQGAMTTIRTQLGKWVEIGSINEQVKQSGNYHLSHLYSTENKTIHILMKIDKTF